MSGTIPAWVADWLNLTTTSPAEGISWSLETTWPWSRWTMFAVVGMALLATLWMTRRRYRELSLRQSLSIVAMRTVALVLLMVMASEATIALRRSGRPTLAILLDQSLSMSLPASNRVVNPTPDAAAVDSRIDSVRRFFLAEDATELRRLYRNYRVEGFLFAEKVSELGRTLNGQLEQISRMSAEGEDRDETRVGGSAVEVLSGFRGRPPAALVLWTDGNSTHGASYDELIQQARHANVPVFTVGVGDVAPISELELSNLRYDPIVFQGDLVTVDAHLLAKNLSGEHAVVQLRSADNEERLLAEEIVEFTENRSQQAVRLIARPEHSGPFRFTVQVESPEDENQSNNRMSGVVEVRSQRIRVLFVQAYPSYEYRYLKHLLERDETIDLNVVLQDADLDYVANDSSAIIEFPPSRQELFEYDVVILGDVDFSRLRKNAPEDLRDFVGIQGGGAIFVAGPVYFSGQVPLVDALRTLLPVRIDDSVAGKAMVWKGFRVVPTELAEESSFFMLGDDKERSRQVWERLPQLYWSLPVQSAKRLAQVWAVHPYLKTSGGEDWPLIVSQYFGPGLVLFHAIDGTWRWRYQVGEAYFARYWLQAVRRLAQHKLLHEADSVQLTATPDEIQVGESLLLEVSLTGSQLLDAQREGAVVQLHSTRGETRTIRLERPDAAGDIFQKELEGLPAAEYHGILVQPQVDNIPVKVDFRVTDAPGERAELPANESDLKRLAKETGGKYATIDQAADLLRELPEGTFVPIQRLPPWQIWSSPLVMLLLVAVLAGEWIMRRKWGYM